MSFFVPRVPDREPAFTWPRLVIVPTSTPPRTIPGNVPKRKHRPRKGVPESPHPSMPIEYLEQLQKDNYVTDGGREFVAVEVDALLVKKREARAARKLKDKIAGIPEF